MFIAVLYQIYKFFDDHSLLPVLYHMALKLGCFIVCLFVISKAVCVYSD